MHLRCVHINRDHECDMTSDILRICNTEDLVLLNVVQQQPKINSSV